MTKLNDLIAKRTIDSQERIKKYLKRQFLKF